MKGGIFLEQPFFGGAQKGVGKRGLSPHPFVFMDLLEISQTLPKEQTTGFDVARDLAEPGF